MQNQTPGGLLDNRSPELKLKDYKNTNPELASAVALKWIEKPVDQWKNYPARDQDGSSSCVAQAAQKAYYILTKEITSAHPIYRKRLNFNGVGMYLYDAGDIFRKQGTVLESQDPSQGLGEAVMNQDLSTTVQQLLATSPKKIGAYVFVENFTDINAIAETIEKYGHCLITVGSNYAEWSSIPQVQGSVNWYHCICATDYVLYQGKKYIVIEESWGSNIGQFGHRRLLSAEFLKTRGTGAMYLMPATPPTPFTYTFKNRLSPGSKGTEVEALQKALKFLGFFPQVPTKKNYGPVTVASVNKFQLAYKDEILTPNGLSQPTGIFGPASIKKMNSLLNK